MDFVHDALADGRPFRILTVVDRWSRQSPLLEVAARMSGQRVSETLDRVLECEPSPRSLRAHRHPRRQRRDGSLGVHEWYHPRLQPSWQTDGMKTCQRPCRIVKLCSSVPLRRMSSDCDTHSSYSWMSRAVIRRRSFLDHATAVGYRTVRARDVPREARPASMNETTNDTIALLVRRLIDV